MFLYPKPSNKVQAQPPPCLPTKCQPPQFPRHETTNRRKPHQPHVKAYQNQRTSVAEARRQRKPVRSISYGVIRVPPARTGLGYHRIPPTVACAPQSATTYTRAPPGLYNPNHLIFITKRNQCQPLATTPPIRTPHTTTNNARHTSRLYTHQPVKPHTS